MANILENDISILAGNLNLGRSYLITAVKAAIRLFRHQTQWVEPISEEIFLFLFSCIFTRKNPLLVLS